MKFKIILILCTILLNESCRKGNEEIPCKESTTYHTFSFKVVDKKTGNVIGLDLADSIMFEKPSRFNDHFFPEFHANDSSFYIYMFNSGNDSIFLKFRNADRFDTLFPIYEILRDKCNNAFPKFYNLYQNGELLKENIVRL